MQEENPPPIKQEVDLSTKFTPLPTAEYIARFYSQGFAPQRNSPTPLETRKINLRLAEEKQVAAERKSFHPSQTNVAFEKLKDSYE